MHSSVYKVGLQYLSGVISGGNAHCTAMLLAFREAIKDFSTPSAKTLNRDLNAKISSYVSFLTDCRLLLISMGNAIRFLKSRIAKLQLHCLSQKLKLLSSLTLIGTFGDLGHLKNCTDNENLQLLNLNSHLQSKRCFH
ncbi:hypothetical protein GUJ93_ZPchr0009g2298 [Zizania palustris]|uniref:Uncharacterized protein n=1 Tax=Zizania palustris TaxID=103762 RepID=A0A8J5V2W8_ZIZPA|nr:hypothetical protein GUJ93_ZPchr0009g2298 [Zizania palustris]